MTKNSNQGGGGGPALIFFAQAILSSGGVRHIVRTALYSVYPSCPLRHVWFTRTHRGLIQTDFIFFAQALSNLI